MTFKHDTVSSSRCSESQVRAKEKKHSSNQRYYPGEQRGCGILLLYRLVFLSLNQIQLPQMKYLLIILETESPSRSIYVAAVYDSRWYVGKL